MNTKTKTIEAGQVQVGNYIWTGEPDRHGRRPHPAYHWTRVSRVTRDARGRVTLWCGSIGRTCHARQGVAVNLSLTEAGRKADVFLESLK